jgi:aminopeptidase
MDQRNEVLAHNLINYSCQLKKGEKVLIEVRGVDAADLGRLCVKEAYKIGALPYIKLYSEQIDREFLLGASKEQTDLLAEVDRLQMKNMDAYIGIRATQNINELSDIPADKMEINKKHYLVPVHFEERITKKWVVLRYPNQSMAQLAGMSLEAFSEFYYNVCNLDYGKMSKAMDSLVSLMERTDKVRITGKGTDLSFSIKDISVVKCAGDRNIPDGEVFTAPVKDSVNGVISYNAPSLYDGFTYENVVLTFENGKIVDAKANDSERINKIFDADEGARYIGEFAIGVNPYILKPMTDILFDEKIMGSFHFTPGNAYDSAFNGNKSSVHWDLVCIQTPEYGGGEIYFDDVLIRKDGMFVLPELECLNPENLK